MGSAASFMTKSNKRVRQESSCDRRTPSCRFPNKLSSSHSHASRASLSPMIDRYLTDQPFFAETDLTDSSKRLNPVSQRCVDRLEILETKNPDLSSVYSMHKSMRSVDGCSVRSQRNVSRRIKLKCKDFQLVKQSSTGTDIATVTSCQLDVDNSSPDVLADTTVS